MFLDFKSNILTIFATEKLKREEEDAKFKDYWETELGVLSQLSAGSWDTVQYGFIWERNETAADISTHKFQLSQDTKQWIWPQAHCWKMPSYYEKSKKLQKNGGLRLCQYLFFGWNIRYYAGLMRVSCSGSFHIISHWKRIFWKLYWWLQTPENNRCTVTALKNVHWRRSL